MRAIVHAQPLRWAAPQLRRWAAVTAGTLVLISHSGLSLAAPARVRAAATPPHAQASQRQRGNVVGHRSLLFRTGCTSAHHEVRLSLAMNQVDRHGLLSVHRGSAPALHKIPTHERMCCASHLATPSRARVRWRRVKHTCNASGFDHGDRQTRNWHNFRPRHAQRIAAAGRHAGCYAHGTPSPTAWQRQRRACTSWCRALRDTVFTDKQYTRIFSVIPLLAHARCAATGMRAGHVHAVTRQHTLERVCCARWPQPHSAAAVAVDSASTTIN